MMIRRAASFILASCLAVQALAAPQRNAKSSDAPRGRLPNTAALALRALSRRGERALALVARSPSAEGSAQASQELIDLLQGARPAVFAESFEGLPHDPPGYLSAHAWALAPSAAVHAPAAAVPPHMTAHVPSDARGQYGGTAAASRWSYRIRAAALAAIARVWGIDAGLPLAGEAVVAAALEEAGSTRALFVDFDDTLGPLAGRPTPGNAAALALGQRRGKQVVIVSDRPVLSADGKEKSLEASLSGMPADEREGFIVAGRADGVVARYEGGTLKPLWRDEGFGARAPAVAAIVAAWKAELARAGVELHDGSRGIPAENAGRLSYALMLRAGTPVETIVAAAERLERRLRANKLGYQVRPRVAHDPGNPPYIGFSAIDKAWAVAKVGELLGGVDERRALIVGDSAYEPRPRALGGWRAATAAWALRLAERLSGRSIPATGNATDADMKRALPGALLFAVGGSAGAGLRRTIVMNGGPAATERVTAAWAAGPLPRPAAAAAKPPDMPWVAGLAIIVLTLAALAFFVVGASRYLARVDATLSEGYRSAIEDQF